MKQKEITKIFMMIWFQTKANTLVFMVWKIFSDARKVFYLYHKLHRSGGKLSICYVKIFLEMHVI